MPCHVSQSRRERTALRVQEFTAAPRLVHEPLVVPARQALVHVTHTAVGVTDTLAARGDYLLHPRSGFAPGYDFVGTVEQLPAHAPAELRVGDRVAGILPHMGAHASHLTVSPSLLVRIPDTLDSSVAATVPLDALTAYFALDALAPGSRKVLVQGAGGAVGAWAMQLADTRQLTVYGTASSRSHDHAEQFGGTVLDYTEPTWFTQLRAETGGVDGIIDHTGNRELRALLRPRGRLIHTAFTSKPGRGQRTTAIGAAAALGHHYAHPRERIVSTPWLVASQRARYRTVLHQLFTALAHHDLKAPQPHVMPFTQAPNAFTPTQATKPGNKIMLNVAHN
ncbi:hypothetical protein B6N42_04225 [Cutibacterium avidum]|nr:zinc-binding dehydrogenase [Cutibacterium avidum]PGX60858.1 hypothetical protein B6N40_09825 [Cutibacterium avidum]PGX65853.1 hypothetical protein B6N41_02140 [Cutibacterium avidum]PGX66439.1 hypothetical protein B6N42_04225 [Cutibacterium avidum]